MLNACFSIVTGDLVPTGGMDRANFALADYIAREGHELHLVAHRVAPELIDRSNVTFHRVPKPLNSYSLAAPLLARKGMEIGQKLSKDRQVRSIVNGGNCPYPDINWVHYVHAAYRPEQRTGMVANLKTQLDRQVALKTERQALQSAKIAIANSMLTQNHLIDLLDLEPSKIKTIYLGIDANVFYPATAAERKKLRIEYGWDLAALGKRPIVTFIGALGDRRKGFDTLFGAWQQLCTDPNWDANLVVIGVGAELPRWQQRAQAQGLVDRIEFLGFRQDVPSILRAADCLVAPTRYEAYGLGVQEALCCGIPAITSATAGIAERYSPALKNLLLADPNDVEDLIKRLYHWQQQHEYYRQQAIDLSTSLRRYTWDDMARDIVNTTIDRQLSLGGTKRS
jgi:glycosyltransferase involved in cell wall biosynthesis